MLRAGGFAVRWADSAAQALAALDERIAPVVVDLASPHAIPAAIELRSRHPAALVVGIEDPGRPGASERARRAGVAHLLQRPIAAESLLAALADAGGHGDAAGARHDCGDLDGMVACSDAMKKVVERVRSARMDAGGGVLFSGEPGTGRRYIARAVHDLHRRPGGKLVEVDCSVPVVELESSLFGTAGADGAGVPHAGGAGAGTRGATERITRSSLACQAIGGSLLLLNVADMPSRLQGRLIRLLRDGEATLVGGGTVQGLIRAMAVVEPRFESVVEEGRLRAELFKRLSATRIDVPPLRDRREDIPALVDHFLQHFCQLAQVNSKHLTQPALTLLTSLPYKGNARELRALIGMLVEQAEASVIRLEDVLRHLRLDVAGPGVAAGSGTLRDARTRFEQQYIREVLERHHGRIAEAAKSLGIQRTNLYRKMRSLGVVRRPENGSGNRAH